MVVQIKLSWLFSGWFLVALLVGGGLAAQGHVSTEDPKLWVSASELDYPPFAVVTPEGQATGFSVELLKAVAQVMGHNVSFAVAPWQTIKQQLAAGKLTVLPLVSYSQERDRVFDFTFPYLTMHGTVFVRRGQKDIHSIADLHDKEVLVMAGDTAHEYALQHQISSKLILTKSFAEAMQLLAAGKHDAVIVQQLVGLQLIKKLAINNLEPLALREETSLKPQASRIQGFQQKFCFAVPAGHADTLAALNEGLALVIANGTYDDLYAKWFSPVLPPPKVPLAVMLKGVAFILVPLLLVVALFFLWYLRRMVALRTMELRQTNDALQEQILARAEINSHNERLLSALDQIQDSVFMFHPTSLQFVYVNKGASKQVGYGETELLKMTIPEVLGQFSAEQFLDISARLQEGRDRFVAFETVLRHQDGHVVPVEVVLQYVLQPEQEDSALCIAIVRNITARKQAMQIQADLERKLQQSQKMEAVGTLAGGIAHDFNNILAAIIGFGELAQLDLADDGQGIAADLEQILQAANRAKNLVQQILAFSRQDSGDRLEITPRHIIKEALRILKATIPSSVEIRTSIPADDLIIRADPTQLHQVLLNLCINGVQAMDEKGRLTISLQRVELAAADVDHKTTVEPGAYACLTVSDTGSGIKSEDMAKIFDPFFTTKEVGSGTGMGLAVVHGVVESHGGMIKVDSVEGQGTTFRLYFPLCASSFTNDHSVVEADNGGVGSLPGGQGRLLVAEDEDVLRRMYDGFLTKKGYSVTTVENGKLALDLLRQAPNDYDVLITDQTMPVMSGLELLQIVMDEMPGLPVILCSGFSSKIDTKDFAVPEGCLLLSKPVDFKVLLRAIQGRLTRKVGATNDDFVGGPAE